MRMRTIATIALALAATCNSWTAAATFTHLSDDFSGYITPGNTNKEGGVRWAWHTVSTTTDTGGIANDINYSPTSFFSVKAQAVAYRDLTIPVSAASDWSVSYTVGHSSINTTHSLWLVDFDADTGASQGYGLRWVSPSSTTPGPGTVRLMRTTSATTLAPATAATNASHTKLAGDVDSGVADATNVLLVPFQLTWTAPRTAGGEGVLKLYVDGVEKLSYSATASVVASFDRIYLLSNNAGAQRYDDVLVTSTPIPEPATLGALGLAIVGSLLFRPAAAR